MKYITLLFLSIFITQSYCQTDDFEAPNYTLIEKNVNNKNTPLHFDKLFERYNQADSTMTIKEKRHLYYGYSFREEYSPYGRSDSEQKLRELLQKENSTQDDLLMVIKYTDDILEQYPVSLRMKEYRIYCFQELRRTAE